MMFRLSGLYPHAELLDEADQVRRRAEIGSRQRRRVLDQLEEDQHHLKDRVIDLARRVIHPAEKPEKEAS
jgi:hypothetical protein